VIEAWNVVQNNRITLYLGGSNIWRLDQINSTVRRFFFRDLSSYYTFPITRDPAEYQVLGTNMGFGVQVGPASEVPKHTWTEAEMLPERLIQGGQRPRLWRKPSNPPLRRPFE